MRGAGEAPPPRSSWSAILATALAAAAIVGGLSLLSRQLELLLLMGSFAASSLLVFAYPDSPFSQPRNVILGHLLGTLTGLVCLHLGAGTWWHDALAVGAAIALMKATRTVHPPAVSNPLIVFALKPGWLFLLFPSLAGAALLILVALVYHNLRRSAPWPKYWL